jgi:hypothetical protein
MSKYAQRKIRKLRLREEIKFLHMKKGKLNIDLYHTPVKGANEWSKLWYHIEDKINETVSKKIGKKYKTVDAKIEKLNKSIHKDENTISTFYRREISDTNIILSQKD